jgi:hypothetical protein
VTNQAKDSKASDTQSSVRGYTSVSPVVDIDDGDDLELSVIENGADMEAMDKLLEKLEVLLFFLSQLILVFAILSFYFNNAFYYCNVTP